MKKQILILLAFLFISFASATVTQDNLIRYGIIEDNGVLTTTNNQITNSYALGFICSDAYCNTVAGTLWNGQPLSSGSSSQINLTFPTQLQDHGYGIYFYKEGYIPFEVNATWAGSGSAPQRTRYLTRKASCTSQISDLIVSNENNKLIIKTTVTSPLTHGGQLNYVPNLIEGIYTTNIALNLTITGSQGISQIRNINLSFSDNSLESFEIPALPGNYSIAISTDSTDAKCLSSVKQTRTSSFSIPSEPPVDTTHPGTITNLHLFNKTENSLEWHWHNPTDEDFFQSIIFLDNVNVLNTSLNHYPASGLLPNSTHTISIKTKDTSGNVNNNAVSRTDTTLSLNQTNETIQCYVNSDCGNTIVSALMCMQNNSVYDVTSFSCNNPGTPSSFCSNSTSTNIFQQCQYGCSNGQCGNTPIQCDEDLDCNDNNPNTYDQCINPGTNASSCRNTPTNCASDFDCKIQNFTEILYCSQNDLLRNMQNASCNNPGTLNSFCTVQIIATLNQTCQYGCSNAICLLNPGNQSNQTIQCYSNSDCNDNNSNTIDICHFAGTPSSFCSNEPRSTGGNGGSTGRDTDSNLSRFMLYSDSIKANQNLFDKNDSVLKLDSESNGDISESSAKSTFIQSYWPIILLLALIIITIIIISIAFS